MKPNYEFTLPIFHDSLIYLFFDEQKFRKWIKEDTSYDVNKIGGIAGYSMWNTRGHETHFAIYVLPDCIETIFHESLHTAWYVLDNHGIKIDIDNHETLTYLQGYLANEIIKYSKKYLKKKEK